MDQGQATAPIMDAPAPALRRDSRVSSAAAPLPAAGAVTRVHGAGSIWTAHRTGILAAAAVVGAGCLVVIVLFSGLTGPAGSPWSASTRGVQSGGLPSGSDRNPASILDLDQDRLTSIDDAGDDAGSEGEDPRTPEDEGSESTSPESSDPAEQAPSNPGTTDPGSTDPGSADPGSTDPGTTDPGTAPTSPTSPTTPTTPPPPAAPKPLAFGTLSENSTSLLGIRLLSSYTLSLTGEPGATASVKYGSSDAGTVRFDGSGRASVTFGSSLIDLGLSNPMIRVAYSDGTTGSAIEARRDSL